MSVWRVYLIEFEWSVPGEKEESTADSQVTIFLCFLHFYRTTLKKEKKKKKKNETKTTTENYIDPESNQGSLAHQSCILPRTGALAEELYQNKE